MKDLGFLDIGDTADLTAAFRNVYGLAVDPAGVAFAMKEPDGTITPYVYGTDAELVREAAGNFYVAWTAAQSGRHYCAFRSTGTGQAAEEATFVVRVSKVS